ncbi:MAG TPA: FAD-dependent oxidoreductase, partial [Longimicrobium sp.]|nr:FAD-dependent oxidoreductase [Longimicrobium sp.]
GATAEGVGFAKMVTAGGILSLLAPALELIPTLRNAPLAESWSGLRPGTPDGLPILGADPDVAGLFYATGHYRNGILLAPITADLLAEALLGGRVERLAPFSIARFEGPR